MKFQITVLCLLLFTTGFCQENFKGKIIYTISSAVDGNALPEKTFVYEFTDSTIISYNLDTTSKIIFSLKDKTFTLYSTTLGYDGKILPADNNESDEEITARSENKEDTINYINFLCHFAKVSTEAERVNLTATLECEMYLSPLTFKCPGVCQSFDVIFNNTFDRIPLIIKIRSDFAGKQTVKEWKAISVQPM